MTDRVTPGVRFGRNTVNNYTPPSSESSNERSPVRHSRQEPNLFQHVVGGRDPVGNPSTPFATRRPQATYEKPRGAVGDRSTNVRDRPNNENPAPSRLSFFSRTPATQTVNGRVIPGQRGVSNFFRNFFTGRAFFDRRDVFAVDELPRNALRTGMESTTNIEVINLRQGVASRTKVSFIIDVTLKTMLVAGLALLTVGAVFGSPVLFIAGVATSVTAIVSIIFKTVFDTTEEKNAQDNFDIERRQQV